ncbi:DUF4390 domain-containing protein [uncultured Thiothrix sp.]|jgi:hypothetical protein|uniref:DUF4390 domain-containing protein n=1 Tax=uncultured Thiothrix sp. TaxID=223185 RepID=UPI002637EEE9|nr:DUF4390 domain-containing protein [uncultured Thiothrix sp.]HMT93702.1 DUF4390 domain-containing protein [Thiolinea sp.]
MKNSWWMRSLCIIFLGWLLVTTSFAAEEKITVRDFTLYNNGQNQSLTATLHLDYQLTDYLRDSLLNGGSLIHEVRFNLIWHSDWWFNKSEKFASIISEVKYHSLSRHYQIVRKDTGEHWNFSNLASALKHLGSLESYKLPPLPTTVYKANTSLYMKASLSPKEPDSLPLGLSNLFSEDHSLVSQGILWALTP